MATLETANDILEDARALIDELADEAGTTIPDEEVETLLANGMKFVNMGVQEVYVESETFETHIVSNTIVPNLLGPQFHLVQHISEDLHYPENLEGVVGAKEYFLTVDSDATVLVREFNGVSWDVLDTLVLATDEEADYKGVITATDPSYPIELVFSGAYFYNFKNRCLYEYPFKPSAIPDYKPWVSHQMPNDYGRLDKIIAEFETEQYFQDSIYKWENHDLLVIHRDYTGTLKVIYKPIPEKIVSRDQTIMITNPNALQFLRFFVAAKMATTENTDLVNFFEGKANEMKFLSNKKKPASERKIRDVTFGNHSKNNYGGSNGTVYR